MLVSALIADGPPSRVVHEAVAGRFSLLLPTVVVEELGRVVTAKLGFDAVRWREIEAFLVDLAHEIPAVRTDVPAVSGDRADDAVLASALEAGATLVVTGDRRHLLPLGTYAGIRLLTPQAFLAELRAGADWSPGLGPAGTLRRLIREEPNVMGFHPPDVTAEQMRHRLEQ